MTDVSDLGLKIEEALKLHPKIRPHGPGVKYLQAYITGGGFVFAAERFGQNGVNLWLPPDHRVRQAAATQGLDLIVREPYDDPAHPENYGRQANLETINELAYMTLFRVKVTSPADAIAVVTPLLTRL